MRLFAAVVVCFLAASPVAAQDRCADILAFGVFEVQEKQDDSQVVSSFVNWHNSALQKKSAAGGGGEASIIGIFTIEGGGASADEIAQSLQSYQAGQKAEIKKIAEYARKASKAIIDAWTACMSRPNTWGLKLSQKFTSDPNEMYIVLQYQPLDSKRHPSAKLKKLTPGSSNVTCTKIGSKGVDIFTGEKPFHCRRSDNKPASVSIETSEPIVYPPGVGPIFNFPVDSPKTCKTITQLTAADVVPPHPNLVDGVKGGGEGINSGPSPSDFVLNFKAPQWIHHLVVWPIYPVPLMVNTQYFGTPAGAPNPVLFNDQTRLTMVGMSYQVDFDTTLSQNLSQIRVNTVQPRSWIAFSEIEIFACRP